MLICSVGLCNKAPNRPSNWHGSVVFHPFIAIGSFEYTWPSRNFCDVLFLSRSCQIEEKKVQFRDTAVSAVIKFNVWITERSCTVKYFIFYPFFITVYPRPSGWDNLQKVSILYENMANIDPEKPYDEVIIKPVVRRVCRLSSQGQE